MVLKIKRYLIGFAVLSWSACIDFSLTLSFMAMFAIFVLTLLAFIENNDIKELYSKTDIDWDVIYATGFAFFSFLILLSVATYTLIGIIMNIVLLN